MKQWQRALFALLVGTIISNNVLRDIRDIEENVLSDEQEVPRRGLTPKSLSTKKSDVDSETVMNAALNGVYNIKNLTDISGRARQIISPYTLVDAIKEEKSFFNAAAILLFDPAKNDFIYLTSKKVNSRCVIIFYFRVNVN